MSSPVYYHEPFFSLNDFQRLLNDLSDAPTDRQVSGRDGKNPSLAFGFQPRMDIHESPEANLVTATIELPGMKKEEVHIDVRKGRLLVSGEQTFTKDVDEKGYIHRERRTGKFSRSLPLPAGTQVRSHCDF